MYITEEHSIEIRITQECSEYGCDITTADGELLAGVMPEYKSRQKAVKAALKLLAESDLTAVAA